MITVSWHTVEAPITVTGWSIPVILDMHINCGTDCSRRKSATPPADPAGEG